MPIIKSAKKAARQAEKRYNHNQEIKKAIRNALKVFKADPSAENLSKAQSEYDKAVKKDLIKKNTASRRKAALVKLAKSAQATTQKPAKNVTSTKKAAAKKTSPKKTAA